MRRSNGSGDTHHHRGAQLLNMRCLMQQLLQRLDRMLMIHSIEGRVPFLEDGFVAHWTTLTRA